jgi:4-hydroxybutyryl-CoA dehydratase/vinylacetyl-CoA-Delta-isomerase
MLTGEQYRSSLRDGRKIFLEGRAIDDVTSDPRLKGAVDWIARGYDSFYTSADARNPLMSPPTTADELRNRTSFVIEHDHLLNTTYQVLMTMLTASARLGDGHGQYRDRMNTYFEFAADADLRIAECITDAKGDRSLPPGKQTDPDSYVRVVDRSSTGVTIRGAKLHITGAALAHELLVLPTKRMRPGEEPYAIVCAVPVNAPGVRILNSTYAPHAADARHFPISSREHMPDGFVVFDDVFVPYERVFLDGEVEHSAAFAHSLGLWERLGGTALMAHEADVLVGLAQLIAEANGLTRIEHIRSKIASIVIYATLIRAGLEAAVAHAHRADDGFLFPDELFTNVAKYHGAEQYNEMVRNLHDIAGGSVMTAPTMADLDNPETAADVRKYMAGADGVSSEDRLRLFHAIRDFTADAFGGWHLVTNVQSGGGLYAQRVVTMKHYDMNGAKEAARRVAGLAPTGEPT